MGKKQNLLYLVLLFIIAVLAFWQIAFFQYSLKYDMIDCSYPWRFMVAEHIRHGMLPMWNPYQSLGYPLFADIQSGSAWYLPVWILGLPFGYNIYVLSTEFVLHIFLAGAGMFYLGRTLRLSPFTAFMMGISYMLSGFFTGNAQHFTLIAGATWFPFVLASYILVYQKNNRASILKTAFYFFMLSSGGYATYTVLTVYVLLLIFIIVIIQDLIKKDYKSVRVFLLNNVFLLVATALLCCVVWLSYADIAPNIARTDGVSLSSAMLNPFSPQSALSFLLPYAVVRDMEFFSTDLSMSNAYLGIVTLVFFIYSLFIPKNKSYYFFLAAGILALLTSFGDALPVRKILYDYIPFMNMMRFPSAFRLFAITGFVVCAAYGMEYFIADFIKRKKGLSLVAMTFVVIFLLITVYARSQGYLEIRKFVLNEVFTESAGSKMIQHMAFHALIQIIVLSLFAASALILKNRKILIPFTAVLVIAEMTLAVQLNAPYTVYYPTIKQKDVYDHHKQHFTRGIPKPDTCAVKLNTNARLSYGPFWRNVTNFHKQISAEGFTSLVLKNFDTLSNRYPALLDSATQHPPIFTTGHFGLFDSITVANPPLAVWFNSEDYNYLKERVVSDTFNGKADMVIFRPDEMVLKTSSEESEILIVQQNYYPGWHATINGRETEILLANKSLMSVFVPAGNHTITFEFRKPLIVAGFYITVLSLLAFLVLGVVSLIKRRL